MQIKFQKYYVTNGQIKVPCSYHASKDAHGQPYVMIYARDYGDALVNLFPKEYENNTEIQTDYFEKAHVTLCSGHPLYAAALERSQKNDADFDRRWKAKQERWRQRAQAAVA